MKSRMLLGALLLGTIACAGDGDGEAQIRYLDHAGWLVRTSQHLLVFDYTGPIENGDLDAGTLSPELLTGLPLLLFVSHAHGDHYTRHVLDLRDRVEDSVLVMGWEDPDAGEAIVPPDGEWADVFGAEVFALHHEFDGIPEGFFLVRSGGVTIYHSGDHGTWSEPPNETFRGNIDRLAAGAERIDIAFISAFGRRGGPGALNPGDIYGIEKLRPRVTFPMHYGGREQRYAIFADEASKMELPTTYGVANAPGALFHYADGELR